MTAIPGRVCSSCLHYATPYILYSQSQSLVHFVLFYFSLSSTSCVFHTASKYVVMPSLVFLLRQYLTLANHMTLLFVFLSTHSVFARVGGGGMCWLFQYFTLCNVVRYKYSHGQKLASNCFEARLESPDNGTLVVRRVSKP